MNTWGRLFRISLFGESHGPMIGVLVDGCPAGVDLEPSDFLSDLERRKSGKKGTTARREDDSPALVSGVFNGKTTGAAITILFENRDTNSAAYDAIKQTPRPGQVDLAAYHKYSGFHDYRGGGMFSGRLTTALVSAGCIAKKIIAPCAVEARLLEAGGSADIDGSVNRALALGDSAGGIIECIARGVRIGLGEPLFDSVESVLSHLVFSIPGIKGIEFGAGFESARMAGSQYNDEIVSCDGLTKSNNSGGINGGITNGNDLVFRVAIRPTASIARSQRTVNMTTGEHVEITISGRHDACFALRVPVIVEAATAITLADFMLQEQRIGRVFTEKVRSNSIG
jgi:chorismate synthase